MELIEKKALYEALEELIEYDPFDTFQEEPIINIALEQLEDIIESLPVTEWSVKRLSESLNPIRKPMTDKEKIQNLLNVIQEICSDIRITHVSDDVCGLCEYDCATQGESGDYYPECPGFDKDNCFCLKESFKQKYLN